MSDWGYRPYIPVGLRKKLGEKAVKKLLGKDSTGKDKCISPVGPLDGARGRTIAESFWGKAWCEHLESFSDYENRLPRGRTYVRNGSVIHLGIEDGKVEAYVQGSDLYKVEINIDRLKPKIWIDLVGKCTGEIDSVVELLQGKLSSSVMKVMTDRKHGLFPQPKDIKMTCSCPDWAEMCKHVAAVLYGVGSRLDQEPELLFRLRQADHFELISKASIDTSKSAALKGRGQKKKVKGLADSDLSSLFGIDIDSGGDASADAEIKSDSEIETKKQTKTMAKTIARAKSKTRTKVKSVARKLKKAVVGKKSANKKNSRAAKK